MTRMILHGWLVFIVKCTVCWGRPIYFSAWEADVWLMIWFFQVMWLWVFKPSNFVFYNLLNVFYCSQLLMDSVKNDLLQISLYSFHPHLGPFHWLWTVYSCETVWCLTLERNNHFDKALWCWCHQKVQILLLLIWYLLLEEGRVLDLTTEILHALLFPSLRKKN